MSHGILTETIVGYFGAPIHLNTSFVWPTPRLSSYVYGPPAARPLNIEPQQYLRLPALGRFDGVRIKLQLTEEDNCTPTFWTLDADGKMRPHHERPPIQNEGKRTIEFSVSYRRAYLLMECRSYLLSVKFLRSPFDLFPDTYSFI